MSLEVKEQTMREKVADGQVTGTPADVSGSGGQQASSLARIPAAVRLQFVVPTLVWVPLIVFGSAWVLAAGIGWWIHVGVGGRGDPAADHIFTGAAQAPLWTVLFMAAYSASHTFPFALALSYSRRVYLIGTLLAFLAVSLGLGLAFSLAAVVEQWTDGYGIHVYNFALPYMVDQGVLIGGLLFAAVSLLLMQLGFAGSMLYKRFSVMTIWLIIIGLVLVLAVTVMAVVVNDGRPSVWAWLLQQTALTMTGWLVLPLVVMAFLNYWFIRRATP